MKFFGVPLDLQSGVKKCPNLFRLCGFVIRSKGVCFSFYWGITNPPVFIGRTFFLRRISNPPGHLLGLPWAWASALYLSLRPVTVGSGRAASMASLPIPSAIGKVQT